MPAPELTIGEVATRSGAAASALRFYEEQGLIASTRTEGNQRRYARAMLRRIAFIRAGRAAGIPLAQIRAGLATLPDDRTPTKRDWQRLSRAWRADLTTCIPRWRPTTGYHPHGQAASVDAFAFNPDDEAAELGPGAHYLRAPSDKT
jgi:MerR family redox-sensitive transcriptional activator SoxR